MLEYKKWQTKDFDNQKIENMSNKLSKLAKITTFDSSITNIALGEIKEKLK